ncbi:MAG: cell division protein FtsQ/DivIB [Candidatus Pelagibacter sp.]
MLQSIDRKYKYYFFGFLFILLSTVNNTKLQNSFNLTSKIKVVEVFGLHKDLNNKIKNKMEYLKDLSIYKIDENKMINNLQEYPFIENYKVSKIYPSKLIIELIETDYLAKTILNNKKYIVGSNGKLIDIKDARGETELPNIFGNFSSKSFIKLIEKINYTKFDYSEIDNFYYFPNLRWDIEMKNNLLIKLPRNNLESTLNKINKIIKDSKFSNARIIDLRLPGQLIILEE